MDNITQNSLAYFLISSMPGLNKVVSHSQFLIVIVEPKALFDSALFLKNNQQLRFDSLLDVWCTDYISHDRRFEVNYLFLSTTNAMRIVVRTTVSESEGLLSLTSIFKSAGWLEREVWDMFGVLFHEHSDLRRILTDYGFEGHPLRKDYPLSGFVEVRYDDGDKRIVYEPLEVAQEYRSFQFRSPWNR
jgi:NADH/F420H2 dehydrogenase subunit C